MNIEIEDIVMQEFVIDDVNEIQQAVNECCADLNQFRLFEHEFINFNWFLFRQLIIIQYLSGQVIDITCR